MANLYGVANVLSPFSTFTLIGGADVACPAATETNIIAATLAGQDTSGFYFPFAFATVVLLMGATPATSITLAIRVGAGADMNTQAIPPAVLVANATVVFPLHIRGTTSQAAYQSPGSVINLTVNPTAQAVTAKFVGCHAAMGLTRASDQ